MLIMIRWLKSATNSVEGVTHSVPAIRARAAMVPVQSLESSCLMSTGPSSAHTRAPRLTWSTALVALVVLTGAFVVAALALPISHASAATITIDQCNGMNGGALGATTGITCTVTVVNTVNGGVTSSTTTLTRLCSNEPCTPGNGTFTTTSPDLVTEVDQCNASGNDAARHR